MLSDDYSPGQQETTYMRRLKNLFKIFLLVESVSSQKYFENSDIKGNAL